MGGVRKRVLRPDQLRKLPREGFGWIDRRLVRDGLIEELTPTEAQVYLFLLCVADKDGLSFYGDSTLARTLQLSPPILQQARRGLQHKGLLAYERPLYQVLELPTPMPRPKLGAGPPKHGQPNADPQLVADLLPRILTTVRPENTNGGDPRKTPDSRVS